MLAALFISLIWQWENGGNGCWTHFPDLKTCSQMGSNECWIHFPSFRSIPLSACFDVGVSVVGCPTRSLLTRFARFAQNSPIVTFRVLFLRQRKKSVYCSYLHKYNTLRFFASAFNPKPQYITPLHKTRIQNISPSFAIDRRTARFNTHNTTIQYFTHIPHINHKALLRTATLTPESTGNTTTRQHTTSDTH